MKNLPVSILDIMTAMCNVGIEPNLIAESLFKMADIEHAEILKLIDEAVIIAFENDHEYELDFDEISAHALRVVDFHNHTVDSWAQ